MTSPDPPVTLVMPCLDEEKSIAAVFARVPSGWQMILVDNDSSDRSAEIARTLGARVVSEHHRGYGAAVDTGLKATEDGIVAVMDIDGSIDPVDLVPLVESVRAGLCDLAVGRRRPVSASWPWPARLGNTVVAWLLNRSVGTTLADLAPVRVAHRSALLGLGVLDRRSGYPVETVMRAALSNLRILEFDITYRRRTAGTRSKVSGSVRGSMTAVRDIARVIRSTRRTWAPS